MTDVRIRPEITLLTDAQRGRVRVELDRRRATCTACGHREFSVGDALYVGFLFVNEDLDAYMVALTCTNNECPEPRTGIKLAKSDFLES